MCVCVLNVNGQILGHRVDSVAFLKQTRSSWSVEPRNEIKRVELFKLGYIPCLGIRIPPTQV